MFRPEDDIAPTLGSDRARREAMRDYFDLDDEIREDEEDHPSTSYIHPAD